jgi:hypothetical protein
MNEKKCVRREIISLKPSSTGSPSHRQREEEGKIHARRWCWGEMYAEKVYKILLCAAIGRVGRGGENFSVSASHASMLMLMTRSEK